MSRLEEAVRGLVSIGGLALRPAGRFSRKGRVGTARFEKTVRGVALAGGLVTRFHRPFVRQEHEV